MDAEQLRETLDRAIDYYLSMTLSVGWQQWGVVISMAGAAFAATTAYIMYRTMRRTVAEMQAQTRATRSAAEDTVAAMKTQMRQQTEIFERDFRGENERYLAERWDQIFKACIQHPEFLDATKTEAFFSVMTPEEQLRYSAFCYSLWDLVNEMVRRGAVGGVRDRALLNWSRELHGAWLQRNPDFFPDDEFWRHVTEAGQRAHMIVRYKPLPRNGDDIDWEQIAPRYHEFILSPMAPSMLAAADGKPRNPLVEALREKAKQVAEEFEEKRRKSPLLRVLDLGCGPGTLVDGLVAAGVTELDLLVMIDRNDGVLKHAKEKAEGAIRSQLGILALAADMRALDPVELAKLAPFDGRFDVVVSINSILLPDREDVIKCFRRCRDLCAASGDAFFILPSFDTTEYLERLWFAAARQSGGSIAHARRVLRAFGENKKMDRKRLLFADDGRQQQGYHSPKTFEPELRKAGFPFVEARPVYYGWELCRPFDYGYFPNALELLESVPPEEIALLEPPAHWDGRPQAEIWDWFVRAR